MVHTNRQGGLWSTFILCYIEPQYQELKCCWYKSIQIFKVPLYLWNNQISTLTYGSTIIESQIIAFIISCPVDILLTAVPLHHNTVHREGICLLWTIQVQFQPVFTVWCITWVYDLRGLKKGIKKLSCSIKTKVVF